jgi:HD-like signal output (HDOD) protein
MGTKMGFSLDLRYHICLQPIDLPVFNPVALELLELLALDDVDIELIVSTINKDPALAVKVLGLANSSAFAGRFRSETIKDSVNRLGAELITNLVMAASQAALHVSQIPVVSDAMRDLWLHSQACALGCRSLAIHTGRRELAEHAYLAGLIHDIGKLYLLNAMEQISLHERNGFELDRETLLDVFSDMHVEQGCRVMGHWNIPSVYCAIVANHHAPGFDADDALLAMVRLVNFNSIQYGLNRYPQAIQPPDAAAEIAALGASDETLAQLEKDMRDSCC